MEIVGLLVIVILIVVIIFFALVFQTKNPKEKPAIITYQDERLASGFSQAILETNTMCGTRMRNIRELIQDCATTQEITCGTLNSCEKINQTFEFILNQTLRKDLHYKFIITKEDNKVTNITTEGCLKPRVQETSYPQPISSRYGPIEVKLTICQ